MCLMSTWRGLASLGWCLDLPPWAASPLSPWAGAPQVQIERGGGRVTNLSNIQSLVSYLIQPQSTAGYLMEQCEENFSNNLFDLNLSHTALAMSKFHNFGNHLVLIIQLYKPRPRSLRILLNLIVDIQSLFH